MGRFPKMVHRETGGLRNSSISDICNFFWYLFNDLNRCPAIEHYRMTCRYPQEFQIKHQYQYGFTILIGSLYRVILNRSRTIPKWNLSLVLHIPTQPPFEPQEKAALKHLTWKTVFLLALASGKRRSEIHGWTVDRLLCLDEWDQVQPPPPPPPLFFIHCQKVASKWRSTIHLSSGHSKYKAL